MIVGSLTGNGNCNAAAACCQDDGGRLLLPALVRPALLSLCYTHATPPHPPTLLIIPTG